MRSFFLFPFGTIVKVLFVSQVSRVCKQVLKAVCETFQQRMGRAFAALAHVLVVAVRGDEAQNGEDVVTGWCLM